MEYDFYTILLRMIGDYLGWRKIAYDYLYNKLRISVIIEFVHYRSSKSWQCDRGLMLDLPPTYYKLNIEILLCHQLNIKQKVKGKTSYNFCNFYSKKIIAWLKVFNIFWKSVAYQPKLLYFLEKCISSLYSN